MNSSNTFRTVAVTLLVVLSPLAVLTVALTGPATAQPAGSVVINGEIASDASGFSVEVTNLQDTPSGCLVVTNSGASESRYVRTDVTEGDRIPIKDESVGGLETGDVIEATLYVEPFECFTQLNSDTETVQEPSDFRVNIDSTNSPVLEGEQMTVTATIENVGGVSDGQTVDFRIGDFIQDERTLTLDSGESQQLTLNWQTQEGDAGTYEGTVSSEDDSDEIDAVVEESQPANFDVTVDSTNSPVLEGERFTTTATIENTGDLTGTQSIDLRIDELREDTQEVTLDGGESVQVTLNWQTEGGDAGVYEGSVSSDDDSDSVDVVVEEAQPANFDVTVDSTDSPVVEGETLGVTATVENTGDRFEEQTVDLRIGEEIIDSRSLALEGGQMETISLEWNTESGDAGEYNLNVASDDTVDFAEVVVLAEGDLDVSIDRTSSPVFVGELLNVDATVTNTGDTEISGSVDFRIGDQTVDTVDLTLSGGASQSVTFDWETGPDDAGEYRATVTSDSDTDSTNVTVLEPPELTVTDMSTNSPVVEGESLEATTTVTNPGDVTATQSVDLRIGNRTVDTSELSLPGGESEPVTVTWETKPGDAGEYVATIASQDDTISADVTVLREAEFDVNITSSNSPISSGESLDVTATVTNIGDISGTQRVTLTADGVERDSRELTLEPSESQEVTISWESADVEPGDYEVEVASQSDSDRSLATLAESDDSLPTTIWVLILLVVLALAAVYYYLRRRQLSERRSNALGQSDEEGPADPDEPSDTRES